KKNLYFLRCCLCFLQGEKNAGFDVLYHNMKHGQIATKELAEFVRERAAIEETYSKSMSKLAKMASNGSPLGTFAPMWDLFRVSSDKLALCHLELMRKMNDLIRDINKYGDEQVKVHRKTKEEQVGTLDAVQAVQVQSGHLQKFREGYHAKCIELDRLRKEGAPQKELEKAEMKSKKSAESFAVCIEKYNRVGGDFEQKMSESAQKFQDIEEAHLRQMKQLIKGYSHSIEDTHVQVGQVHEEFKQNVENIGIDNLIQRFAEQKGTGKDRPALVGFEEYMTSLVPEGSKKSRGKAFRIPGLGKRDKESLFLDSLSARCSMEDKEDNFYSSDSDFDDEEPKKFHIQIRPVGSSSHYLELVIDIAILPTVHLSRGPSPISLSTQELWPVAAAITEYINAYFKGGQHNRCLVKITGDLTMSFPAGITRIFTANPNAPVLSFRLVNISRVNHFLPNQKLLYSDPSQSDPDTRDFWFNMQALNLYLQREAELNPLASYYNVALLKYQVTDEVQWYSLTFCHLKLHKSILQDTHFPSMCKLLVVPGSGTLCASWQCLEVPRGPPPSLAVQFVGSGASLSGMDVELVGSHYRMSLVKKRFATGKYMAGCSL
uniref:F-BAR domain only protein 1 n=1 Tax=Oncorhynchus tshawytscha TaxID=74940 RepID=A0AAZ3PZJ3_ONCTS